VTENQHHSRWSEECWGRYVVETTQTSQLSADSVWISTPNKHIITSLQLTDNLAHSAKLPTGLYILPSVISFFFIFFFFNDSSEKNYLKIRWTIFAIFSPNESVLGADDRSGPLFSISQGTFHGNWFCEKNGKLPIFIALAFRNGMGYRYLNVRINSANDACISCENFVKFSPVTPELRAHLWMSDTTWPKNWHIWLNISGSTRPIFVVFTPYESALWADSGFVAYFPICQGTLPWQPNNVTKMSSTPTDTTCIRCTSARKQIATSWSSCVH